MVSSLAVPSIIAREMRMHQPDWMCRTKGRDVLCALYAVSHHRKVRVDRLIFFPDALAARLTSPPLSQGSAESYYTGNKKRVILAPNKSRERGDGTRIDRSHI